MEHEGKRMFFVGHLRSERDALALGRAICALPKVETPPTETLSQKRRREIEAELDAQDECCRRGVHCGVTYSNGRVERHACCDRPVR